MPQPTTMNDDKRKPGANATPKKSPKKRATNKDGSKMKGKKKVTKRENGNLKKDPAELPAPPSRRISEGTVGGASLDQSQSRRSYDDQSSYRQPSVSDIIDGSYQEKLNAKTGKGVMLEDVSEDVPQGYAEKDAAAKKGAIPSVSQPSLNRARAGMATRPGAQAVPGRLRQQQQHQPDINTDPYDDDNDDDGNYRSAKNAAPSLAYAGSMDSSVLVTAELVSPPSDGTISTHDIERGVSGAPALAASVSTAEKPALVTAEPMKDSDRTSQRQLQLSDLWSNRKTRLIIIGVIVLIAVLVVTIIVLLGNNGGDETPVETTTTPVQNNNCRGSNCRNESEDE